VSPYLITAKPNRLHRMVAAARRLTVATAVAVGLALLAAVVFGLRTLRVFANLAAEAAARAEFAAAHAAHVPPLGATLGATVTAAFVEEFHARYTQPADDDLVGEAA
jgi:hypothetical protein